MGEKAEGKDLGNTSLMVRVSMEWEGHVCNKDPFIKGKAQDRLGEEGGGGGRKEYG